MASNALRLRARGQANAQRALAAARQAAEGDQQAWGRLCRGSETRRDSLVLAEGKRVLCV
jgi:hypothetical protein